MPRQLLGLFALVGLLGALTGATLVGPGISPVSATTATTATTVSRPGLPTLSSPIFKAPGHGVSGRIAAPGGPYLYDSQGRIVFFHGVDAVYKYRAL